MPIQPASGSGASMEIIVGGKGHTFKPGEVRQVQYESVVLNVVTRELHDRLCAVRVATPQEGTSPEVSHCHFCGLCYSRPAPYDSVERYTDMIRRHVLGAGASSVFPSAVGVICSITKDPSADNAEMVRRVRNVVAAAELVHDEQRQDDQGQQAPQG